MLGIEKLKDIARLTEFVFVPTNDDEYEQLLHILDEITDTVRDNESHPLAGLMDVLGVIIESYENDFVPEPENNPAEMLKYLMRTFNLKQSDLPEIGSQSVVSEILHGKRRLNTQQIKALAQRLDVSPAVFI